MMPLSQVHPQARRRLSALERAGILIGIGLILVIMGGGFLVAVVSYQRGNASPPDAPVTGIPAGYLSTVGHIETGRQLWLKSDQAPAGTIMHSDLQHSFPDGTTRRGAYVEFKDGTGAWIPWEAIHKLYLTK